MTNNELRHIAPILFRLKEEGVQSGFNVPNNYFVKFEEGFISLKNLKIIPQKTGFNTPISYFDNLEEKVFQKIEKKNLNQSVPENYFENFEDRVFKRLEKEKIETKIFHLKKHHLSLIAIAAMFLVLITLYNPFKNNNTIDASEIESYLADGYLEIDSYEIADIFSEVNLEALDMGNTISNEDIENYLMEEISDENLYN